MGQGNRLCSPQLETPAAVKPFPMDTITSPNTRIHHETLPTPPSSPSKSTITPPPDTTNTPSGDLPPPHLINSANELRGFSTALSDFLNCYDELLNHISFINSSIDSKLSGHLTHTTTNTNPNLSPQTNLLKTLSNQTIPAFPEVLSDQIPKKYQGRNGIATAAECDACSLSSDGIDTSKKAEIVGTSSPSFNRKQIDNGKRYIGIRLSKWGKWGAEVSKRHRRNKRIIRSSIWLGSYSSPIAAARAYDTAVFYFRGAAARFNFPDLVGEYGCVSDLSMACIQKKAKEVGAKVDALLSRNRSADQHRHLASANSEEIDVCMKDADIDTSKKAEEVDVLNNPEEIDTSKKAEEVDVLNNPEEINTSKKAEVVDASNSPEEIDTCMQDVEMDTSKAEDIDIGNNPEEVDLLNNPEEVDVSNNHVDLSNNPEEINVSTKPEEIDVSNKPEEVDISNNPGEVDVSKDPEEVDLSNNSEEIDVSNNPEEVDIANNPKEVDVSMDTEETDDISMKLEETDVLKKHAETDNSKKPEEMVAENFCAQTITTVPVAVVLEQNPNEMATNCEQDLESTTALGIFEEVDVSNKPEVVDTFKKSEQTDILKKPEQTVILKRPKEIDILKKAEQTDIFKNSEDMDTSMNPLGIYASKNSEEAETAKKHEETVISKKAEEIDVSRKLKESENSKKGIVCVLEVLCKNMYASLVRKHVITYWYSMNKLHKEIAKALKMAKNPARLVLHSIQRFFMNSWKSYVKDSRQKIVRLASVLILECFVMISGDGIEISKTEKEYAEQVATDWRDRMSKGGGLGQTDEIDARGLLLFISGFGIRDGVFKIQDIVDLIRASNVKEISNALRASVFLIPKIPDVIDYMVKNNLEIQAADIAYTLGLEDVCHPENILRTYLHSIVKDSQNSSSFQTLEAMKQHLCDLKSVKQCLESHNVDPSILLLDFEINARIQNLERETNEGRLTQKMKCLENPIHPEANDESMQKLAGHAETDSSNGTEAAVTETSCAQTINSVSEAVVLKQNPSRMAPNHKQTPEKVEVVDISKKPDILKNPEETETGNSKKSIISALESYCQNMSFKNLVTHITTHFSEMRNCHEEIVKALKLATDPAKLVLYSIGRFFVQGSSTFYKDPHQTVLRLALVLILECFVMMSCDRIEIANTEKEHAVDTAAEWRNRMIKEGGLGHTDEVDARGLLLFISGFGIQDDVFTIQDIMDLIMTSNVKGISTALRGSVFLMAKLPEVIDLMMKNKFQTKAVDIAYTLGLEDKCSPQNILRMYLHSLVKDIQLDSSLQTLDTRKQQLFNLKSIKQCLESHKVDPSILLPDFKVNEMIEYLLIEVNVEEMILKRKSLENPTHPEAKRACLNRENMPHQHKLVVGHHGVIPYNQSTQPSTRYFNNSENKDGLVPNGPAYGLPGSYDQSVHRADVPPSGWHGPNGQTYVPQPDGRQCEQVPPESFSYVPPSSGFPGRPGPREPFPGYKEVPPSGGFPGRQDPPEPFSYVPPSGGFPGRPGPRQPFPGYKEVPPSGGLPGRPGPHQPFPGYKEVPPSGGFPGRQDPPEPYNGVKNYPPSGGFPRRQGPSADLYSFIDKI